jgi:hypothetical protein
MDLVRWVVANPLTCCSVYPVSTSSTEIRRILPMMIGKDIPRPPVPDEDQPGRRRCLVARVRQRSRLASTGGTDTHDSEYRQRQSA